MRRALLVLSVVVVSMLGGVAEADTPAATAPGAPTMVQAIRTCLHENCTIAVSWQAPDTDGGSPVTSYQVTGDVSEATTTVEVTGTTPATFSVSWDASPMTTANAALLQDTSYSVVALNGAGASIPATAAVQARVGFHVSARSNGARNDVLRLHIPGENGTMVAFTVNGRWYARMVRKGTVRLVLRDRNGARWTSYVVRYGGAAEGVSVR